MPCVVGYSECRVGSGTGRVLCVVWELWTSVCFVVSIVLLSLYGFEYDILSMPRGCTAVCGVDVCCPRTWVGVAVLFVL